MDYLVSPFKFFFDPNAPFLEGFPNSWAWPSAVLGIVLIFVALGVYGLKSRNLKRLEKINPLAILSNIRNISRTWYDLIALEWLKNIPLSNDLGTDVLEHFFTNLSRDKLATFVSQMNHEERNTWKKSVQKLKDITSSKDLFKSLAETMGRNLSGQMRIFFYTILQLNPKNFEVILLQSELGELLLRFCLKGPYLEAIAWRCSREFLRYHFLGKEKIVKPNNQQITYLQTKIQKALNEQLLNEVNLRCDKLLGPRSSALSCE